MDFGAASPTKPGKIMGTMGKPWKHDDETWEA